MDQNEINLILDRLQELFSRQNISAYLVGGFVRDSLLNRSTADIDIAVGTDALQLGPRLATELGGKYVLLDQTNGVCRVVLQPSSARSVVRPGNPPLYIDLSTIETTIEADLERRDFTIDAMAIDLNNRIVSGGPVEITNTDCIIDPHQGQRDLQDGLIRTLNQTVFKSDPARLLRAFRLAAELGFRLTPACQDLIKSDRAELSRVAGERIHDELVRLLAAAEAGAMVRHMDDLGILSVIFPELEASRNVAQPKEHHWDVLNHSLETVNTAGCVLRESRCMYIDPAILAEIPWSPSLSEHFGSPVTAGISHAVLVKLAALLHDIAKPETRLIDKERVRFFGHNELGAESVVRILERLRFSHREIRMVECMVRHHMRPTQMSHDLLPSRRAIFRYYRDTGSAAIDILFLSLADHLAARGPELDLTQWHWHLDQVKYILNEYTRETTLIKTPRLINGHDLINELGLSPGPQLREILENLREAQAAGEITNRAEALSYAKNRLIYKKQNY